jgi:hypothetical protein
LILAVYYLISGRAFPLVLSHHLHDAIQFVMIVMLIRSGVIQLQCAVGLAVPIREARRREPSMVYHANTGGSTMSMVMQCSQCGRVLARKGAWTPAASISGSIMGDEHIESWFFCNRCGVYTVEVYHDRFMGEDEITRQGPVPKERGDAQVALIRRCSRPSDKKCRCDAHRKYFGSGLD